MQRTWFNFWSAVAIEPNNAIEAYDTMRQSKINENVWQTCFVVRVALGIFFLGAVSDLALFRGAGGPSLSLPRDVCCCRCLLYRFIFFKISYPLLSPSRHDYISWWSHDRCWWWHLIQFHLCWEDHTPLHEIYDCRPTLWPFLSPISVIFPVRSSFLSESIAHQSIDSRLSTSIRTRETTFRAEKHFWVSVIERRE